MERWVGIAHLCIAGDGPDSPRTYLELRAVVVPLTVEVLILPRLHRWARVPATVRTFSNEDTSH